MSQLTIDLLFPPSVNRLWRGSGKHVYRSKEYMAWIADSQGLWVQQRAKSKIKSIRGYYTLKIILNPSDKRRRDLGNFEKATSDFLQSAGIIDDDCLCRDLHLVWGSKDDAPNGARLILTSCEA